MGRSAVTGLSQVAAQLKRHSGTDAAASAVITPEAPPKRSSFIAPDGPAPRVSAPAGFPYEVGTAGQYTVLANATTHAVPYPTVPGGILAGDILIAVGALDGAANAFVDWGTFTQLKSGLAGAAGAEQAVVGAAYKVAAGGETGTESFHTDTVINSGAGEHAVYIMYCFRAADSVAPEVSTGVGASAANPDPDSLTPSWGSLNTTWLAIEGHDNSAQVVASAPPAGYSNLDTMIGDTSGAGLGVAQNWVAAATENPGAFTMASEQTFAFTLAIKPASAGGGQTISGGTATENDAAAAGTAAKLVAGGTATENDAAQAGAAAKTVVGATATESDAAQAGAARELVSGGTATENDAAQGGTIVQGGGGQTIAGGTATENDAAQGGVAVKAVAGATATENDAGQNAIARKSILSGAVAPESDSAPTGAASKLVAGGVASSSETAPAGANAKLVAAGFALEQDSAPAGTIVGPTIVLGGVATEGDAAPAGAAFITGGQIAGTIVLSGAFPRIDTTDGPLAVTYAPVDPQLHAGFMRDGGPTGPLILTTQANAVAPITYVRGFLRDARYFLVVANG